MPPSFEALPHDHEEPSAACIVDSIIKESRRTTEGFDELVFAGLGEPLLRWDVVREVINSLASLPGETRGEGSLPSMPSRIPPIRLVTNGLWLVVPSWSAPESHGDDSSEGSHHKSSVLRRSDTPMKSSARTAAREIATIFDSVSIALNTADAGQYGELMRPTIDGLDPADAHGCVCDLIRECVRNEMAVECTIVDREDVDVERAQSLATDLGAAYRVRPYFK